MIPFGNKTVTLYHRGDTGITRHVLTGCSWAVRATRSLYDSNMKLSVTTICRYPSDQQRASIGDIMVLGECSADAPASAVGFASIIEDNSEHGAFVVESFRDNTGVPNAHYCAQGA